MTDWKKQLQGIKRTKKGADTAEKSSDKPLKVDFVPPTSWLEDDLTKQRSSPSAPSTGSRSTNPDPAALATRPTNPISPRGVTNNLSAAADRKPERAPAEPNPATAAPVFHPRIDPSRRLSMPEWAGVGKALQHPEARGDTSMTVRLGIDFGTAFTKVALRAGPDLVIVDWSTVTGDVSSVGRWIVPGCVCRGSDGGFGWRPFEGGEWLGNLKLPLVESLPGASCPYSALAYLALVIRYSRAFLYQHQGVGRSLANRSLRWELNLGCPTEPHERPEIVEHFAHVARTAWRLAGSDDLNEAAILAAWEHHGHAHGLETQPGVVPEFVGQIAGYLKSLQVQEGLHALVDVGAATLDVATFNVVLPNEGAESPRIPIFFSAVELLGTHFLSQKRHSGLGIELAWDDAKPIENAAAFARQHDRDETKVNEIDVEFAEDVTRCIVNVLNNTRRNPRGNPRSPVWREALPVSVTGGGSTCEVYGRAIKTSETRLKDLIRPDRFRFIGMNLVPENLAKIDPAIDPAAAVRLTVAIGLTEDAEDIAHIVPHRDIGSIPGPVIAPRPDRDELYPK